MTAIKVENLSKLYRIGAKQERYKTLRDSIMSAISGPFRKMKQRAKGQGPRVDSSSSALSTPLQASGSSLSAHSSSLPSNDGYIWALRDVSFSVKRGEVVGIIGRNGAGKTTLLKILSRITEPTEGQATVYGRLASLLEVGTGFHPELTGRENIYLNGAILGMKKAEIDHKFDEIVAFAEIEKFIDTPVKHYSSGMYVRLAFAVAAHLEPEILLVDEVLAVGDAAFQKKCLGKMGDVAKEGRTVLFVSHNMGVVDALCSKAFLLNNGEIAASGKADEVIKFYLKCIKKTTINDLSKRKDRSGSGRVKFTSISLEDGNGMPTKVLVCGKDANIVLNYKASDVLNNVSVSLGFYSLYGQFLLLCNNEMAGQPFELLPKEGKIRCSIPNLPFTPGIYNLNLHCEVNGILADWIQEAYQITVVEGDYYGSGKLPPASHGGFLVHNSWSYRSQRANDDI